MPTGLRESNNMTMDEMNKLPEDQNNEEIIEQETPAPESEVASEPVAEIPVPKAPIPKLPFIIGGAVAGVAAIAVAVTLILGGGNGNQGGGNTPEDNEHEHSYSEWTLVDEPTCTEVGSEARTCECGDKETRPVAALGHKYDNSNDADCNVCGETREVYCTHSETEIVPGEAATCKATGLTDGEKCKACGVTLVAQQETPKVAHTYDDKYDDECNVCGHKRDADCAHTETEVVPGKAASCTAAGLTDGSKCKKCGETLVSQSTIPVKAHTDVIDSAVAATCTSTGLTEGKHCSVCSTVLLAQTTVPMKPHTEVVDVAVPATCTATGLTEGKHCSVCSRTLVPQTVVSIKPHTEVVDPAVAATCTSTGLTEGKHCSSCSKVIVYQQETQKVAHTYDDKYDETCNKCGFVRDADCAHVETEVILGRAASCTATGLTDGTKCKKCGEILIAQNLIPMTPHTEVIDAEVAATCTSTGLSEGKHCSACNTVLVSQTTVPRKPHTEVIDYAVEATCTSIGYTEGKHCSVCNAVLLSRSPISKKPHTEVIDPALAATCTTTGLTEGRHCSVCGAVTVWQEIVRAKGHTEVIDAAVPATCTNSGLAEGKHCSVCSTVIVAQEVIKATGHYSDNPTITPKSCQSDIGQISYTCDSCETPIVERIPDVTISFRSVEHGNMWSGGYYYYATYTVAATGGYGDLQYRFEIYRDLNEAADLVEDYSASSTISFQSKNSLTNAIVKVYVKDSYGNVSWATTTVGSLDKLGEGVEEATHIYNAVVTDPTKAEDGYTTYTCSVCNDSYMDDFVPATGSFGLKYKINDDGISCTITGMGTCTDSHIVIPAVIDGYAVTGIGNSSFYKCTSVESITILNSVTYISYYAFDGCTSLEKITIPDSITRILNGAFDGCESLADVYYSGGMEDWCKIQFSDSYANPMNDGANLYLNGELVTDLIIPDTVNSIGRIAFCGCTSIKTVVIPESVVSIDEYAFYKCSSITDVYYSGEMEDWCKIQFGNSYANPMNVGANLYCNGKLITNLITPDTGMKIGNYALYGCASLTSIRFKSVIPYYSYSDIPNLETVVLENGITSIGEYAFKGCDLLTDVVVPDSVTRIGYGAFSGCSSLESITLPFVGGSSTAMTSMISSGLFGYIFGGSEYIGSTEIIQYFGVDHDYDLKFYIPTSLKTVTITGGILDYGVLVNCSTLINIKLSGSVTSVGDKVFNGCTSLQNIEVDESNQHYKSIDGNLYTKDGQILMYYVEGKQDTSFIIPDSVTSMRIGVFMGCTSLTSVTIPNSLTSISDRAFMDCSSLKSINIPSSVTSIGASAFDGCYSLEKIVIPRSVKTVGKYAFRGCNSITIYLEGSITNGWDSMWNPAWRPIVWDYTGD